MKGFWLNFLMMVLIVVVIIFVMWIMTMSDAELWYRLTN